MVLERLLQLALCIHRLRSMREMLRVSLSLSVKGEWADAVLDATKDLFFDFIGSPA